MSVLDEIKEDYDRADALVHLLIDHATGAATPAMTTSHAGKLVNFDQIRPELAHN